MESHPSKVLIFDRTDRLLHLTAALLGPLAAITGAFARRLGPGGTAWSLHGLIAYGAIILLLLHLARVLLLWLQGGGSSELLARPRDFSEAFGALLSNLGLAKPRPPGIRGFRQRLSYCAFLLLVPALAVTGAVGAHPSLAAATLGPAGLLASAGLHALLGFLFLAALLWHLYFTMLSPSALWWNPALLTGYQDWEKFKAMHPASATERTEGGDDAQTDLAAQSGPGVEELLNLGNLCAREGDFSGAAAAFRRALELYPGYPQALFNLGASLFKLGDDGGAREVLDQYLQQDAFGAAADRARTILADIRLRKVIK